MKTLKFIGMALLAVVFCVNIIACSNDDNKPTNDELISIITSTAWSQDGDNDIFVVSSDGTGFAYNSPELYRSQSKSGYSFKWTYTHNIIKINYIAKYYEDGTKTEDSYEEILTVQSYNKNQIVFKRTDEEESDIWTWTRFE